MKPCGRLHMHPCSYYFHSIFDQDVVDIFIPGRVYSAQYAVWTEGVAKNKKKTCLIYLRKLAKNRILFIFVVVCLMTITQRRSQLTHVCSCRGVRGVGGGFGGG